MSWVRVYIHLVFSTKNREPLLNSSELRKAVFEHIKDNSKKNKIWLDCISGHQDHAHCLIALGKDQTISKVVQLIKGESSFWINQNLSSQNKFAWQDDYWCVGVSESHIESTRKYIHNQEEHHSKLLFKTEIDGFMKKYGWSYMKEK